jgi:hypothetical protein
MPIFWDFFTSAALLPSKEQQGKHDAMMRRLMRRKRRLMRLKGKRNDA